MSSILIGGDTSGAITISAPAVSGTTTLTLPAVSGTILQSGTVVTVAQGGTGVTTSTGSGAVVLGTSPTITGATITVASTAAPAFSAYQSTLQSLTNGVFTKVQFQTEEFDTNSNYDNVTNYRFTPTVAGYYQVSGQVQLQNATTTEFVVSVYKNGSSFKYLGDIITGSNRSVGGSALISMNGSTDYVELYAYTSVTGNTAANQITTYFQAAMIRSA